MPSQVRSVEYKVSNIRSLEDLIEMMRYDGFRFPTTHTGLAVEGDWRESFKALAMTDAGVIAEGRLNVLAFPLVKDQVRHWQPTFGRWYSFGMEIEESVPWEQSRQIN